MNKLKQFWKFLQKDTWQSWLVSLVLIIIFIKFVFFPILSLITSSPLPLVVVESCSMYHEADFGSWWESNKEWYKSKDIIEEQFQEFPFKNGLNKGDIIFVWGRTDYKIGDIIIFMPNKESLAGNPLIHRIVETSPIGTKGDHNSGQLTLNNNVLKTDETSIPQEKILGKSAIKIPAVGWLKLIFYEPFREPERRGFCR